MEGMELKEGISTEELLAKIDEVNSKIDSGDINVDEGEMFVGSLDAEALYPSLDTKICSKQCGTLVANSEIEFKGVDWEWATLYVACNIDRNEIIREGLGEVVPGRRFKRGQRPGMASIREAISKGKMDME